MIRRDYEQYQLHLIAAEYRFRGYTVDLEAPVPQSNARFDALASGPDGNVVIIELVNAERDLVSRDGRLEILRQAAVTYPNASVDLRYIDPGRSAFAIHTKESAEAEQEPEPFLKRLNSLLAMRLPRQSGSLRISIVRLYLTLWALHVATLQAFAMTAASQPDRSLSVLDQYDALLKRELLVAPEQSEDSAELDLYQLYKIAEALLQGGNSTVFFYLDPFGIKDIDFDMIRQIFQRNPSRSTEVLINFNFRTFMRMSGNWNYAASAEEVAERVKASKVETVNEAMGGDYWQAIVLDPNLNKLDREDAVVQAYLSQIKKYVRFAFAIPVKERTSDQLSVPVDELAHYHLIFGTRSPKAVEYMNDVALNALEPYLSQFTDGLLFDLTPERYKPAARSEVKDFIVSSVQVRGHLRRPDIYDLVVPEYFRQYRLKDYRAMIDELVFIDHRLFPDAVLMKRANQLNDTVSLSAESAQNQLFGGDDFPVPR